MAKSDSSKDINKSLLHNSNQIINFIKFYSHYFEEDLSTETLNTITLFRSVLGVTKEKFSKLFGNNISKTNFINFSNMVIIKFLEDRNDLQYKLILEGVTKLMCSITDGSELFCKQIAGCVELLNNLVGLLRVLEYNENNGNIVGSVLIVINNIVRREQFRKTLDSFDIIDIVTTVKESAITGNQLRIVCIAIVQYTTPVDRLSEVAYYSLGTRSDVIELLDAASNSGDFRAEGFSAMELVDLLAALCRNEMTRVELSSNQTLSFTLLRLLAKNHFPGRVINLVRAVYIEEQFNTFKKTYVDKHGLSNEAVIELFGSF